MCKYISSAIIRKMGSLNSSVIFDPPKAKGCRKSSTPNNFRGDYRRFDFFSKETNDKIHIAPYGASDFPYAPYGAKFHNASKHAYEALKIFFKKKNIIRVDNALNIHLGRLFFSDRLCKCFFFFILLCTEIGLVVNGNKMRKRLY
jgi:hypothetical protein